MLNTSSRKTDLPLRIGLTGGIGSGKSLAASIFRILGIPVFEADMAAKDIINTDLFVRKELTSLFGSEIYSKEGSIDRKQLASVIFNDPQALALVNQLVHPLVSQSFDEWAQKQKSEYVLQEAAILFESGFYRLMDSNILITAPEEIRISRTMERDHTSRENVITRMRNQWDQEEKGKLADYIIINDETHFLIEQILETDKKIRAHGKIC